MNGQRTPGCMAVAVLTLALQIVQSSDARACVTSCSAVSTAVRTEAVSCYGGTYDCTYPTQCPVGGTPACSSEFDGLGPGPNIACVNNAQGLLSTLNSISYASGNPYKYSGAMTTYAWYNRHVWDSDLYDPQLTGNWFDDD